MVIKNWSFNKPANILAINLRRFSRSKLLSAQYSHALWDNLAKVPTVQLTMILFHTKRSKVVCLINIFQYPQDCDRPRHVAEKRTGEKSPERKEEREKNGEG